MILRAVAKSTEMKLLRYVFDMSFLNKRLSQDCLFRCNRLKLREELTQLSLELFLFCGIINAHRSNMEKACTSLQTDSNM